MAGTVPEPGRARRRQGSEMRSTPDFASHPNHDPELIAAYAAGDATGPGLEAAAALVARCPECSALHHDLRAIRSSMTELPAPRRPRDFRLTVEQAASLRPTGWRGLVAVLAGPRFRYAAPLGTAMAALGLAGLLLTAPGGTVLPMGGQSTSVDRALGPMAGGGETAAPSMAAPEMAAPSEAPAAGQMVPGLNAAASPAAGSAGPIDITGEGPGFLSSPPAQQPPAPAATGRAASPSSPTAVGPTGQQPASGGPETLGKESGSAGLPGAAGSSGAALPPGTGSSGPGGLLPVTAALLLVLGLTLALVRLVARRAS